MVERVLVTGGAGYIGSTLVQLLLNSNIKVNVIDCLLHDNESLLHLYCDKKFKFFKGDIEKEEDVENAIQGCDAVIHLAAIVGESACLRNEKRAFQINYEATKKLYEISKRSGIKKFIFSSTCSNYGITKDGELCSEKSPTNPISAYAKSKVMAEQYILNDEDKHMKKIVLRFATVYGISRRMRFDLLINDFTKEAYMGNELKVYATKQWRPYIHVFDLSRIVKKVLLHNHDISNQVCLNAGFNSFNYRKEDIIEFIRSEIPIREIIKIDNTDYRSYKVDFSKIEKMIELKAEISPKESIKNIVECLKDGIIENPNLGKYYN